MIRARFGFAMVEVVTLCLAMTVALATAGEPDAAARPATQPPLDVALTKRMLQVLPRKVDAVILTGPIAVPLWPLKPTGYGLDGKLRYARVPPGIVSFDEYAYEVCTSLFEFQPQLMEACRSTPVEFTLTAFQRGSSEHQPYEHSQIIVFKSSVPPPVRQLLEKSARTVAGIPMIAVTEEQKRLQPVAPSSVPAPSVVRDPRSPAPAVPPPQKYWYASPTERVLVASSSEGLMTELLQAFSTPHPVDNGWTIPKLAEDLKANTWACRKFDPENLNRPPAVPTGRNAKATQVTLVYERPKLAMIVQTFSADPKTAIPVERLVESWREFGKITNAQRIDPNSARLTVNDIIHDFWMVLYLISTYDGMSIPI